MGAVTLKLIYHDLPNWVFLYMFTKQTKQNIIYLQTHTDHSHSRLLGKHPRRGHCLQ